MNNRQPGRRRGRGNQRPQGGGNSGRDNGNRIDNRARGNAAQLLEKYKNLAADAQRSGDRVNTEYYLQFADHYFRVLDAGRARFEEARRQRDDVSGDEDDDEIDGEDGGEDRIRDERPRERQPREERGRDERSGDDRGRDDRGREDRQPRSDRGRDERPRRQPREDRAAERGDMDGGRNEASVPSPAVADVASEPDAPAEVAPVRRRTPRAPRRDVTEAAAEPAEALEADRLPPALSTETEEERPRRRRRVRTETEELPPAA